MASWKHYDAWSGNLYGICGPMGSSYPSYNPIKVACESAYFQCGQNAACMRDYILNQTSNGLIDICRGSYNLMVTTGEWAWSGYGPYVVESASDGHWSECIFYCTVGSG